MTETSCWTCRYIVLGGLCFPGACTWFVEVRKEMAAKQIPADVIDKGCLHWKEKETETEIPEGEI